MEYPEQVKKAIIEDVEIGYGHFAALTIHLRLNYGGSFQIFGGFALDGPYDEDKKMRLDSVAAGFFIRRILEIARVQKVSDLIGAKIMVRARYTGVIAIGNLAGTEWFYPEQEFKELLKKAA